MKTDRPVTEVRLTSEVQAMATPVQVTGTRATVDGPEATEAEAWTAW